ncbi:hypothetical protein N7468_005237 [Penicillium chermesinum]|uniref:Spc7 kinetochore protein domain-containing protein n=1 Tax=Penicillium chermesinum TaxID=63820 RepID=A0A9W9TMT0_9EURO|nr:uncharacterized protein N7468_005237 [Penicillium chermesinum]KAJ5232281.1 hypothetical protein N7468_005237 [Penicillium chermesinum]
MSTRADPAATRPRSRRSIAHVPRSKMTSGLDKENATADIGATPLLENGTKPTTRDKKSRSKSLGPGGLDALQSSNGNRRKSTASFPLKSILKPTVPVSPVRNIPSFEETRRRTPARDVPSQTNAKSNEAGGEGLLIDFATPPQPSNPENETSNPFDTFNAASAVRDEMAATKERDEQERRDRERQNILEKREARRKSMDAHLLSQILKTYRNQHPPREKDIPSSPGDAESDFGFSPVRQQDLEQMRGSGTSIENQGGFETVSSSPFSGSSVGSEETGVESVVGEDDGDQSSGSDDDFDAESTAMSMDDMTSHTVSSMQSEATSSTSASAKLNEALRQAAREAGTQALDEEYGEMSMEIAGDEITGAFQPWIKKGQNREWEDLSSRVDQENVDPSAKASVPNDPESDGIDEDEELSMDVTNAIGRILGNPSGRRQSTIRRKSSGQETIYDDQTMEMTTTVGGISQMNSAQPDFEDNEDEDEGMTMEFTAAVGGLLNKAPPSITQAAEPASPPSKSDGIDVEEDNGSDGAMDMEITGAVGGILPSGFKGQDKGQAKRLMELEVDSGQLNSSPFQESVQPSPVKSPAKSPLSFHVAAVASENGSPSLANVRRSSRRSSVMSASSMPGTPQSATRKRSPSKKPSTPSKQSTPQLKPTIPSKTPPSANVSYRSASPKQLFRSEIQKSAERRKSLRQSIFEQNAATGQSTPRIVLQPREGRRSSGLGIDKEGIGSPKVAALLDQRPSLGENTPHFVPKEPSRAGVRFEDPLKMQADEERARAEEELREDGHIQPDGEGPSSLRDKISSLSPKKNKIGSRKSLHVGAARGILGKRPAELDLDEEEAENSPKRLRGHDVSPVKGLFSSQREHHPTQPPRSASETATTPLKEGIDALHLASDPQQPEQEEEEENNSIQDAPEVEPIQLQEFLNMTNIHFMELTTTKRRHTTAPSSATKRLTRSSGDKLLKSGKATFDDCVAAGFCTVPMLELYQHSCRELKSYISEGRQVIRSIEAETYADNPPLFQEYVNAPPDIRVIMDNQFRNVKTHARLLSKATWYEWRMKLLEGLKEGLSRHVDDMTADDELLSAREALLSSTVPPLMEKHALLEKEANDLQILVEEMESCDQDELRETRKMLSNIDEEIEVKKRELRQLQEELEGKTVAIESGTEMRDEYLAQIQEAERMKEECRGWSARDISELKASVRLIERQTGWAITSASTTGSSSDPLLTMLYRGQLQIKFHPGAFAGIASDDADEENVPLELAFVNGRNISPIASLVLQSLQRHLATIKHFTLAPKTLLRFVSKAWDSTLALENEARMLEFCGVTRLTLLDSQDTPLALRARCTILGHNAASSIPGHKGSAAKSSIAKRIDVDFNVKTSVKSQSDASQNIGSMDFDIDVLATKVYGFGTGNKSGLTEKEIQRILGKDITHEGGEALGSGMWCRAVQNLSEAVF